MATRIQIRNISQQALALPLPLKGVLSAGNEVITSLPKATLLELFNTSPYGSEFVELTDMPLTSLVTPGLEEAVDMGGSTFTNLAAPVNATDAATKLYVDTSGGGGGGVSSVSGTAPIASSGGATPAISISAATTLAAGSMSAADKTKLDGITAGAAVASVGTTSPITNTGTATAPVVALTSGVTAGNVLTWNGTAWASAAPVDTGITQLTGDVTAGPGSGSKAATVAKLQGNAVSSVAPSDGQVLTWNGSAWVPGAPASGGSGGGGQVYFLNAGTPAQLPVVNLPGTPAELGLTAEVGSTTITSAALPSVGFLLIAGFVTELNRPDLDAIPAGVWDFNVWISASSITPNVTSFRLKVYTYDGTNAPTLVSTGATTPVYDPTQTIQYVSSAILPQTVILTTDRIYVEIEGSSSSGTDTITVNFGSTEPSHGHTTLPSVAGTGIVHVINGVMQSPASPVDLTAGATEISGTLPISNGGTGTSTVPANGQLLIGNGTGYSVANIGAGTGISVTNGAGTVTVANTGVTSVGATAPIASSGGTTPTISISAATTLAPGSMSAADKTKLDGITAGAAVASVGGTAPIASSGGTSPTISISAATTLAPGSMSAADKTKLDGITAGAAVASVGTTLPITDTGTATAPVIALTAGVTAGDVLTWGGAAWAGAAPAAAGITAITGDVTTTAGPGSVTATVAKLQGNAVSTTAPTSNQILQWISGTSQWTPTANGVGLGSKVLLVVEGGAYATLQAAVNAASANDVILVGPKATGDWGNVTLSVVNKPLTIAAVSGAGSNKIVAVGSITYDLGTTGPALNVNLNETYLYGLYIQGSFAGSAVTLTGGASYPGRLRMYGCYILNTNATGAAAVTNSNSGASSSLYLDSCVVSLSNSAAGSAIVQTAGYTFIRNRCDVSGSLAGAATGNAINVSAGTMEIYDSYISLSRAVPTINVTGATTFVSVGYSTVLNGSDAAGACCAYIGTSGARFGAGDATLASGSTLPTSAVAVSGVAGGIFLYANVSFSFVSTVSTVTSTATPQSGGLFSYGMSVGTLLGTTFTVSATGNITKLNNVTTSFPSAQGTANQVLTNNGSGTLTWANGNLNTLGSVGATPTAANLRTNTVYTVNVAAVALPAMAAGDDGLVISLVNISGAGSTVTPSTGVARSMTTGGGQTWVWRNTGTTWYCLSNV